jgi:hypothetical protein
MHNKGLDEQGLRKCLEAQALMLCRAVPEIWQTGNGMFVAVIPFRFLGSIQSKNCRSQPLRLAILGYASPVARMTNLTQS